MALQADVDFYREAWEQVQAEIVQREGTIIRLRARLQAILEICQEADVACWQKIQNIEATASKALS